jgi:hypothetical protein
MLTLGKMRHLGRVCKKLTSIQHRSQRRTVSCFFPAVTKLTSTQKALCVGTGFVTATGLLYASPFLLVGLTNVADNVGNSYDELRRDLVRTYRIHVPKPVNVFAQHERVVAKFETKTQTPSFFDQVFTNNTSKDISSAALGVRSMVYGAGVLFCATMILAPIVFTGRQSMRSWVRWVGNGSSCCHIIRRSATGPPILICFVLYNMLFALGGVLWTGVTLNGFQALCQRIKQ